MKRTGTYTLETQKALHPAMLPEGLYPELGLPRIEIDLQRQGLLFFDEQGLNRGINGLESQVLRNIEKIGRAGLRCGPHAAR